MTFFPLPQEAGLSLRRLLLNRGFSQKLLVRLKQQDGIRVDGQFHRLIDPVAADQEIRINLFACEAPGARLLPAPELSVPVLYEDEHYIIFDKPADLAIHPCARHYRHSLGNYFAALYPSLPFRPVGRLDKDTTGLCAVAKNPLAAAVANRGIQKIYYAVAEGALPSKSGRIDLPLIRLPGESIRRQVAPEGLKAVTEYQVLEECQRAGKILTLAAVKLITGRTHQIRAHFAYLGFPLAGDLLYGGSREFLSRQALHCGSLLLPHPQKATPLELSAPFPPDMAGLFPDFNPDAGICF